MPSTHTVGVSSRMTTRSAGSDSSNASATSSANQQYAASPSPDSIMGRSERLQQHDILVRTMLWTDETDANNVNVGRRKQLCPGRVEPSSPCSVIQYVSTSTSDGPESTTQQPSAKRRGPDDLDNRNRGATEPKRQKKNKSTSTDDLYAEERPQAPAVETYSAKATKKIMMAGWTEQKNRRNEIGKQINHLIVLLAKPRCYTLEVCIEACIIEILVCSLFSAVLKSVVDQLNTLSQSGPIDLATIVKNAGDVALSGALQQDSLEQKNALKGKGMLLIKNKFRDMALDYIVKLLNFSASKSIAELRATVKLELDRINCSVKSMMYGEAMRDMVSDLINACKAGTDEGAIFYYELFSFLYSEAEYSAGISKDDFVNMGMKSKARHLESCNIGLGCLWSRFLSEEQSEKETGSSATDDT